MTATSLRAFVDRVAESKRLGFGDLRRLQRDILPNGPETRRDVEDLLALDRSLDRADSGWAGYLAASVKTFVLASAEPPGTVGPALAEWLVAALAGARPKTALEIARAVVGEAASVDEALQALAKVGPKRRTRTAASTTGLASAKVVGPAEFEPAEWPTLSFSWGGVGGTLKPRPKTGA